MQGSNDRSKAHKAMKNSISIMEGSLSFSKRIFDGLIALHKFDIEIIFKKRAIAPIQSHPSEMSINSVPFTALLLSQYRVSPLNGLTQKGTMLTTANSAKMSDTECVRGSVAHTLE